MTCIMHILTLASLLVLATNVQAAETGPVERLSAAIRHVTISGGEDPAHGQPFEALNRDLQSWFPQTSALRQAVRGSGASRLYFWPGSDPSLEPVLLLAHTDVVPVDQPGQWQQPPFSGAIAGGYIWGRGTLDDKSNALAHLEALQRLHAEGFQPRRGIWIAHGHDEEVDGSEGARRMADYLQSRGVMAWFSLDEGGAVTEGLVPGVAAPVAAIMAGEKGYLSVQLTAHGPGGHSSTPAPVTAIDRLARALQRIRQQPMPPRIIPPVAAMLDNLAPELPWYLRLMIAARGLFEPLLIQGLEADPTVAASVRTTMAPTMLDAGVKDNVIPALARAVVNVRLLPGDSVVGVLAHLREVVADPAVDIEALSGWGEPPPVSDPRSRAMGLLRATTREVFPDAIPVSGIVVATTDSRHYQAVRRNAYYFSPFPYRPEDAGRVHGRDERIAIEDYLRMIDFYTRLIRHATG